jgi:hypothetical protein
MRGRTDREREYVTRRARPPCPAAGTRPFGGQQHADLDDAIPELRHELAFNVGLASPADLLQVPSSGLDQPQFVRRDGSISLHYYRPPTQVNANATQRLERDLAEAELLVRSGAVDWENVERTWVTIRASPTGRLRHEPAQIEHRLRIPRRRQDCTAT